MPERKHGLPQIAPGNLEQLFRVLERSALVDLNVAALRREGITQAKHVHALLRALGFLEKHSSHLAAEIQACRRAPAELAWRLRDGIVQRCAAYAPQLGDLSFVFDRSDNEAVRGQLKTCLAGELSINQVICSLMALRKEVRDRLARSGDRPAVIGKHAPHAPGADATGLATRDATGLAESHATKLATVMPRAEEGDRPAVRHSPPAVASAALAEGAWRVDEIRDAGGELRMLKMHVHTPRGCVTIDTRLHRGAFEGVEVSRGPSPNQAEPA